MLRTQRLFAYPRIPLKSNTGNKSRQTIEGRNQGTARAKKKPFRCRLRLTNESVSTRFFFFFFFANRISTRIYRACDVVKSRRRAFLPTPAGATLSAHGGSPALCPVRRRRRRRCQNRARAPAPMRPARRHAIAMHAPPFHDLVGIQSRCAHRLFRHAKPGAVYSLLHGGGWIWKLQTIDGSRDSVAGRHRCQMSEVCLSPERGQASC